MNKETKLFFERKKYREENNITGKYIYLYFITNNKKDENIIKRIESIQSKIRPIGICLYNNKKYHTLCCAMTWSINMITDDLEYFEEETKDNWSGEKGKFRNENCWQVLQRIQSDMSFQSWFELCPSILNSDLNHKDISIL